jgi:Mg-chelatase subunit ChlD
MGEARAETQKETPMTQKPTQNSAQRTAQKAKKAKKATTRKEAPKTVHFYVLLDRSGSMESMKSDVIGGFNDFLRTQRAAEGRARMTMVQFDSQDPQDTVADAVRLEHVVELTDGRFQPRGGTPLLDATAMLIERVLGRQAKRRALGKDAEEIVFITITDGEENQSRHTTLEQVRALVTAGQADGWSFVYLGAGIDAYGDAMQLGYDIESVQAFCADGQGANEMWLSVSRAASQLRSDVAAGRSFEKAAYFRGMKEAEARRNHS